MGGRKKHVREINFSSTLCVLSAFSSSTFNVQCSTVDGKPLNYSVGSASQDMFNIYGYTQPLKFALDLRKSSGIPGDTSLWKGGGGRI